MSAESLLEPLYRKLSAFSNITSTKYGAHPRSKPAAFILQSIDEFIKAIVDRCQFIRHRVPQLELEIGTCLTDVLDTANLFRVAVEAFTANPTDSIKDTELQLSATTLLSAVSRLLILLGVADASLISDLVQDVRLCVQKVAAATSPKTIATESDTFAIRSNQLLNLLSKRSTEAVNPDFQEQYSKARCILKTNGRLLATSARVCLEHPDHIGAQNAKDYATKSLLDALNLIDSMLEDNQRPAAIRLKVSGKLLDDIEEFENNALIDTSQADNKRVRANLEQHLNGLLPSVYRLADAQQTTSTHKKAAYAQCNKLQQTVGELISQYNQEPKNLPALNSHMEQLLTLTSGLKQLLGRIAVDHATQTFLNKDQPLMVLRDATKFGNEQRMDAAAQQFQDHSAAMVATAYEVCALTTNEEVSKSTQLACTQIEQLCPQVVGSAYLLFRYPHSRLVEANFDAFCEAYERNTNLLLTSVNEMTSVHDVLAVTDDRMRTDFRKAMDALAQRNEIKVQLASLSMERRCVYVCDLVTHELEHQRNNRDYVNKVTEKATILRDEYTRTFNEVSRDTLSLIAANQTPDEARFRGAASNLCTAVHDVRITVLNETGHSADLEALQPQRPSSAGADEEPGGFQSPPGRKPSVSTKPSTITSPDRLTDNELEKALDSAFAFLQSDVPEAPSASRRPSRSSITDQLGGISVAQENQLSERDELFAMMTGPEKEVMAQEFAGFLEEKKRFMREVVKWDDSANEVVALAKRMCVTIMDMTDFTRGKGSLTSTMEVIESARKVSDLGKRLNQLCRHIADMCPNSASRRDLLAYLQRITLHCQQLSITSRVKAGVQAGRAEVSLKISTVENSTALVQAARNLMTAVILTIKQSYIASTKYLGPDRQPIIHWQMCAPPKKQLIQSPSASPEHDDSDAGPSGRQSVELSELSQFDQAGMLKPPSRV